MKSSVLNFGWGSLLPLLILVSCASKSEKKFNELIEAGKCEEAALHVPQFQIQKTVEEGVTATTASASYVLTSAAYSVDVVYYITGGVALPVVACMPAMFVAAPVSREGAGSFAEKCFEKVANFTVKYDSFGNPKTLGSKMYKKNSRVAMPEL